MATDDKLLGAALILQDFTSGTNLSGKRFFRATFYSEVENEEVLNAVKKKFYEGVKIYTEKDFTSAIVEALREENAALERKAQEIEKAFRALQEEARKMRESLSVLDKDLGF